MDSIPCIKGDSSSLALQGAYAGQYKKGIHHFNVLYRSPTTFSFTDCQYDYKENKNLYATMLPPSCKVVTVNPRTVLTTLSTWTKTDLQYSLKLSKLSHVITMYQLSGHGPGLNYHLVTRIKINTAIKKHTTFHSGKGSAKYYGNFGLWQGSLNSGTHSITMEYHNSHEIKNKPNNWQTRTLTVVQC